VTESCERTEDAAQSLSALMLLTQNEKGRSNVRSPPTPNKSVTMLVVSKSGGIG
jgi:hypothetical protein